MDVSNERADSELIDGRASRWAHRKPTLLAAATEYVLDNGVSQLTLRPLAEGMGVTISTIVRQFGSKVGLIEEITRSINAQLIDDLRSDPELADATPVETLRIFWHRWLAPENSRQFRLMFELYGLALQHGGDYQWFIESVVADWLLPITEKLVHAGIDDDQAEILATVVLATLRGLHLDYVITHDAARVNAAFELAVSALDPFE